MELTKKQILFLKGKAHPLKPVVLVGQKGLTDSVFAEIDAALLAHELIKIKVSGGDHAAKETAAEQIVQKNNASLVQVMGSTITVFKKNKEHQTIILPKE